MNDKAKTPQGLCNIARRARGLTCEEWRAQSDDLFKKAATDIFKNIKSPMKEDEDIKQHLEMFFVECYNKFMEGDNQYEFPPTPGAFYMRCYYQIAELFTLTKINTLTYVNSTPHDSMIDHYDQRSIDFDEDRDNRIEAERDYDLYRYLEVKLDIVADGSLGPEFAFWWLGYSYADISVMLNAMDGGRGHGVATVQRRMDEAFNEIEAKHDLSRKDMRELRKGSIAVKSIQGND